MEVGRTCPEVPPVACHIIPDIAILDQKLNLLDLDVVRTHLLNEGKLSRKQVVKILNDTDKILRNEKNLLEIDKKCFIFGDTHGQFYDLVALLDLFDFKTQTLLFLGDYVDRGMFSVETYLYLMLIKARYPKNLFLLRGNHESQKMTSYFTFKLECLEKYDEEIYKRFLHSFNTLPIAAVVQKKAFCSHGGISPHIKKVADINLIDRFREIVYKGAFCDVLWSDPHEHYDLGLGISWEPNNKRNCSVKFTFRDAKAFLDENDLKVIIRAHEVQENGYRLMKTYKGHPSVITIFSAPSYCDVYQNFGAYLEFDQAVTSITQFRSVIHPYVITGFFDGINWSLPFISEKILEFTKNLFSELDKEDMVDEADMLVSSMALMRKEREAMDEFENEEALECEVLSSIENEFDFEEAKLKDAPNEKKKSDVVAVELTTDMSPSLQDEVLGDVVENISKDEEINLEGVANTIEVTEESGKEKISIKDNRSKKKKSRVCKYLCGE